MITVNQVRDEIRGLLKRRAYPISEEEVEHLSRIIVSAVNSKTTENFIIDASSEPRLEDILYRLVGASFTIQKVNIKFDYQHIFIEGYPSVGYSSVWHSSLWYPYRTILLLARIYLFIIGTLSFAITILLIFAGAPLTLSIVFLLIAIAHYIAAYYVTTQSITAITFAIISFFVVLISFISLNRIPPPSSSVTPTSIAVVPSTSPSSSLPTITPTATSAAIVL